MQAQRQLVHHLPQWQVAKQGQPNNQPNSMLGRQLTATDRRFSCPLQSLLNPGTINESSQLIKLIWRLRETLAQCA
nr:hypothetical protein [Comamonas kerstersii]